MPSRIQPYSVIGHRGAPVLVPPGNTIASLQKAVDVGAQMVEVDVRITQDNVLVVDHEAVRYYNGLETPLRERTYRQWKELPSDVDAPLTTLEDVFAFVRRCRVGLMLDFKEPGTEAPLARAVRRSGLPMETVLISGADETSRRILRGLDPRIPLCMTIHGEDRVTVDAKLLANVTTDAVNWNHKLITPQIVKVLQMQDIVVYAGTVNLVEEMRRLSHVCGVNGIITDCPDILRAI